MAYAVYRSVNGGRPMKRKPATKAKSFCIAIVVFLLTLAGCSNADPQASTKESGAKKPVVRLEYWTPFSGGDNQFMTSMVGRFNKDHPNIMVVQMNSRLDDYYSRLKTAILAGNAPDVAVIHTTSLPQFVQNGYIEDLTESAKQVSLDWSGFNRNILKSTVYEGRPYAVPFDTHALVMYYNKSLLRKAGVLDSSDKPVIGAGPEGFIGFLQQIREAVASDVAALAQPSTRIDSVWLWWSLYNQMEGGGVFYNPGTGKAALDNPQALKALEYVNELYNSELIPPNINDAFKLFYEGRAAVLITGMWGTGAFEKAAGLDFGAIPVPTLYDRPAVWGDSHTLAIPTKHSMTDDKRAAIMTFAKWMVEHGELWAQAGHVPSVTGVVHSKAFSSLKYRSDYAATANFVAYWPRNVKQWSIIEILIREFERMIYDKQTPKQTLENATRLVDIELNR